MRAIFLLMGITGCSEFGLNGVGGKPAEDVGILEVDPGVIDFGVVDNDGTVTDVVTLTSVGSLPVTIEDISLADASTFSLTVAGDVGVLEPGASTDVIVRYTPASADDTDELIVRSDATEPTQTVHLLGAGNYAAIEIDPNSVLFSSNAGETVTETVWVTSAGTANLEISSMLVQGDPFAAEGEIPIVLPPGERTLLTVTYTPEVAGETVSGKIWLSTNTDEGYAVVPLLAQQAPECIGLGEAWDRGDLTAVMVFGSALKVTNASVDDVCIDTWYVWLSEGSQDLGAGDMNGDMGGAYPSGSITLSPGTFETFGALDDSGPAWYCMEQTQQTDHPETYTYLAARVPEPLVSYMQDGDQDASWAWQTENAVMLAGRVTNRVEVSESGGSADVTLRILNMGGKDGTAEVRETVPVGYEASDFSQSPIATETNADGDTVYVFSVSLDGRTETDLHLDTIYDDQEITYTLTVPACTGRQYIAPMETRWRDSDGIERTDTANPLAVVCE